MANDWINRYQVVVAAGNQETLEYDANGNLVVERGASGIERSFEWDAANRMTAINNGTHRTEMVYDGLSRRVEIVEKDNGAVTSDKKFVWCDTEICEERDSTGDIVKKRFYPQGAVLNADATPQNIFYTRDHLGSVRELTDNNGIVVSRYDYDAFGRQTLVSGTDLSDFGFMWALTIYAVNQVPNSHTDCGEGGGNSAKSVGILLS